MAQQSMWAKWVGRVLLPLYVVLQQTPSAAMWLALLTVAPSRCWLPHYQVKIRLANIDAPEKAQPFGQRLKQAMSDLAFGKAVECNQSGLDRYGRTIAVCIVSGVDINLVMVKAGMA